MGYGVTLTKPAFETLIKHLVHIEENMDELAGFYFPDLPMEKEKLKVFFKKYVKKIEAELEKAEVINSIGSYRNYAGLNEFSFAIIGSQVDIVALADDTISSLMLIHPTEQSRRKNEVTYLSPIGRAMILKETGSEFEVPAPGGGKRFSIRSVKLLC